MLIDKVNIAANNQSPTLGRDKSSREREPPLILIAVCAAIAVLFHLVTAIYSRGFYHADEHFQILEFLMSKLPPRSGGQTPFLAWEHAERIRPWLQIGWYWLFTYPLALVGHDQGSFLALVIRLVNAALGLGATACMIATTWHLYPKDVWRRGMSLFLLTCLFYVPFLHVRTSSENYGGLLAVFAASLYVCKVDQVQTRDSRSLGLCGAVGFLWGLSFHLRFQMALAIVGFGFWLLFVRQLPWRLLLSMTLGFTAAEILGVVVDHWGYGTWVWTPWLYFKVNILQGKADEFGVSPWWEWWWLYGKRMLQPYGLFVLLGGITAIAMNRKNLFAWICGAFLIGHTLIGHKEDRFLFPLCDLIIPLLPVLFIGLRSAPRTTGVKPWRSWPRLGFAALLLVLNFAGLAYFALTAPRLNIPSLEYLEARTHSDKSNPPVYWRQLNPFTAGNVLPIRFYANSYPFAPIEVKEVAEVKKLARHTSFYFFNEDQGCAGRIDDDLAGSNCTLVDREPMMLRLIPHLNLCSLFSMLQRVDLYRCNGHKEPSVDLSGL